MKGFLSDNSSSVDQKIMESLIAANSGHTYPYGEDGYTQQLEKVIKVLLGENAYVTVVMNGTGANVLGISSLLSSYNSVICVDSAHINVDECGAFENLLGAKIVTVPHDNGKLNIHLLKDLLSVKGNFHHNQPKVISISQVSEYGSVYTVNELKDITRFAHENGLYVHMDGARISNAAVSLDISFKEMITETDIDIVSFGGTKNGMMFGELIICYDLEINNRLKFIRKQGMQLASKMRYVSAQFLAFFDDDLCYKNAKTANDMCQRLVEGLKNVEEINFLANPDANIVFLTLPVLWIKELKNSQYFYTINEEKGIVRFVTSFDTTVDEIDNLLHDIKVAKAKFELLMD